MLVFGYVPLLGPDFQILIFCVHMKVHEGHAVLVEITNNVAFNKSAFHPIESYRASNLQCTCINTRYNFWSAQKLNEGDCGCSDISGRPQLQSHSQVTHEIPFTIFRRAIWRNVQIRKSFYFPGMFPWQASTFPNFWLKQVD